MAAGLKETRKQEQEAIREDHLTGVSEGLAPVGAAPPYVGDPAMFYNWRARKVRNAFTKAVCSLPGQARPACSETKPDE